LPLLPAENTIKTFSEFALRWHVMIAYEATKPNKIMEKRRLLRSNRFLSGHYQALKKNRNTAALIKTPGQYFCLLHSALSGVEGSIYHLGC
jgi:hypothetical protein